jgi:hypothetical protein
MAENMKAKAAHKLGSARIFSCGRYSIRRLVLALILATLFTLPPSSFTNIRRSAILVPLETAFVPLGPAIQSYPATALTVQKQWTPTKRFTLLIQRGALALLPDEDHRYRDVCHVVVLANVGDAHLARSPPV